MVVVWPLAQKGTTDIPVFVAVQTYAAAPLLTRSAAFLPFEGVIAPWTECCLKASGVNVLTE